MTGAWAGDRHPERAAEAPGDKPGGERPSPSRLAALLLACCLGSAQAGDLNDAVYAEEQARSGRKLYEKHCIQCHERQYFGRVLGGWRGERLSELFLLMSGIMPEGAPGSLSEREYLDILAYMLSLNGFPAGEKALVAEELGGIRILPKAARRP